MPPPPLLLVDIDGVISLFGFDRANQPEGQFVNVDGIPHLLSATAGDHLRTLGSAFELAWCSGWEEKANEYLPRLLGLEAPIPHLTLTPANDQPANENRHWKLDAIDRYSGQTRPLAWIDDAHDDDCDAWAAARPGRTLLVRTDPAVGLTGDQVEMLLSWSEGCADGEGAVRIS